MIAFTAETLSEVILRELPKRLQAHLAQPGTHITQAEIGFLLAMRSAAAAHVGYGWMQQVIEWEWEQKHPGASWGPEYYEALLSDAAQRIILDARTKREKKPT